MSSIYLLDCTLRDGGYVNNWTFGAEAILQIKTGLERAGVDIIELGFVRDEAANQARSVFSSGRDLYSRFGQAPQKAVYSAMIEASEPADCYPVSSLGTPDESGIDLIRVCIWKRLAKEHLSYCRAVGALGYRISVQPTAVGQYSLAEFTELLKRANEWRPYSFYVVDTWGTQSPSQICRYLECAERYLGDDVKIGYHGHNNKMQALSCVQAALDMNLSHDLYIDASVMGMGRGAGNLQTEVVMDYLNERANKRYQPLEATALYMRYLRQFYEKNPWGYSLYHYLSAQYNCSQDFATYFKEQSYSEAEFKLFLDSLQPSEKIVFRAEFVEARRNQLGF